MENLVAQVMSGSIDREVGMRRITVQAAVQRKIYCPDCDSILDCRSATVLERDTRAVGVSCDRCYRAVMMKTAKACQGRDRKYIESMLSGLSALRWNEQTSCSADVLELMQDLTEQQ